jgi:signal transduction histidine kinase
VQTLDLGSNITKPNNRLFCRLDGLTPAIREQKRLDVLRQLNLLAAEAVPVFEEATQTASAFLEVPICILGLVVEKELWFKSAVGLSTIGLMNQLASYRKLPLIESFSIYVVDSEQPLAIDNTVASSVFASSILTQHYGIKAYLGVPLISSEGLCLGTLEIMDLAPRNFTPKDIDFLALTARWCLREFERNYIIKKQQEPVSESITEAVISSQQPQWNLGVVNKSQPDDVAAKVTNPTSSIEVKLLGQLTQELRTPLTSVIGMASVLRREVYGPLTTKQREYLEIIHNSGQNLISLVDEIISLGVLSGQEVQLKLAAIDIEMLCQQAINSLVDIAEQHQQSLRLSIEPGDRIWSLDKEKVRQTLYYLILSVIEMSEAGGEVRVHVSHRHQMLNIAVWFSHPWLGEGLPQIEFASRSVTKALALNNPEQRSFDSGMGGIFSGHKILTSAALMAVMEDDKQETKKNNDKIARDFLGLLFSCHLAELHDGQIVVQGSPESGYRYVLQFLKAKIALESASE